VSAGVHPGRYVDVRGGAQGRRVGRADVVTELRVRFAGDLRGADRRGPFIPDVELDTGE
jgi:hypothetical protein